ncbi:MAG: hypothetical protein KAQ99_09425, partial [Candidatus Aureabacteria bacterium]|nr:hypothetical protein [Candidatus Auribacterota bacterium]
DVLTITPVADQEGSDVVTLTLTDSGGLTVAQDITVTIMAAVYPILTVNDTPTLAEITVGGEEDMYQFTVAEAGTYSIETQLGTLADTYIYLYGPNNETTLIKENDDGGEGSASYIFRSLSSGIYYVKVRSYSVAQTGTYTVQVTGTPAPPPIGPTLLSGIAGGENHSYVEYDGTVWSWGSNSQGAIGNGSDGGIFWSPVSIDFTDAVSLASIPYAHSLALKSDGTVWGWGRNELYELGIGSTEDSLVPIGPLDLSDIVSIKTGHHHGLALKSDGTVWSWGYNWYGQLGLGPDAPDQPVPAQIPGLNDIINIGSGAYHSFAVKSDGTVLAWGYNYGNQLGDGSDEVDQWIPVPVLGLTDVISAIGGGWGLSLALKSDGTVWGWGPTFGQLADKFNDYIYEVPFLIPGLDNITNIVAGSDFFLALKSDGTVWSWGENAYGRLGVGTNTDNFFNCPAQVLVLTDVTEIACGSYHCLARKTDGSIWAWGKNQLGAVGLGDESIPAQYTPVKVLPIEVNTPPVISSVIPDITTTENTPVVLDLTFYESDTEDGPAGDGNTLRWFIAGFVNKNLLTASIDSITDELTITPFVDATGSAVITLILVDSGGLTDTQNVTVTITEAAVNNPPVIALVIPDITTSENIPAVFDLTAYETDTEDGPAANDNSLTWSISGVDETLFTASIDSGTDVLTITPALDASGTDVVTLTLTDSGGLTDTKDIIITVGFEVMDIAAGRDHSLILKSDGTVWSCGKEELLGEGMVLSAYESGRSSLVQVAQLNDVTAITAGRYHNLALRSDKTVYAWGANSFGQLGNGTTDGSDVPIPVPGLTDIIALATKNNHNLALDSSGNVWAWGDNTYGQIGNGEFGGFVPTPIQISGLINIAAIAAGDGHSLALDSDENVWAWGYNEYGQLGDGTNSDDFTPKLVPELSSITGIGAGSYCSFAVSSGNVYTWGRNNYGQLGNGTTDEKWDPTLIGLTDVTAVSGGVYHSLAYKTDGSVWAWGMNSYGQLGDSTNDVQWTPVPVGTLSGINKISAGGYHSLALQSSGSVYSWGHNYYGKLGDGTYDSRCIPLQVKELTDIIAISAGDEHNLAVKSDGTVWAWGWNIEGQVGDDGPYGSDCCRYTPVQVVELNNGDKVAALEGVSACLDLTQNVWAWGDNWAGMLGDGSGENQLRPVSVVGLSNVTAIEAGSYHILALDSAQNVWGWGYNGNYQLGDYAEGSAPTPIQISGLSNITALSASDKINLVLDSDGNVWTWGSNPAGFGDGTTDTIKPNPMQVPDVTGITAVGCGYYGHFLAVKSNKTVLAWGNNNHGQLGDDTDIDQLSPVPVLGLMDVTAVEAGGIFSMALKSDGTVWAWGSNTMGQLGTGTFSHRELTALPVLGLSDVTAISAGYMHGLALKSDKTVWAWGHNGYGQLGTVEGETLYNNKNAPGLMLLEYPTLTISNVTASDLTVDSITINWTTSEPATSQVEYGVNPDLSSTTAYDIALVLSHSQTIEGLTADDYIFRIRCKDFSGKEVVSGTFNIDDLEVNTAPEIVSVITDVTIDDG